MLCRRLYPLHNLTNYRSKRFQCYSLSHHANENACEMCYQSSSLLKLLTKSSNNKLSSSGMLRSVGWLSNDVSGLILLGNPKRGRWNWYVVPKRRYVTNLRCVTRHNMTKFRQITAEAYDLQSQCLLRISQELYFLLLLLSQVLHNNCGSLITAETLNKIQIKKLKSVTK
jgi:hypothetical protein